MQMNLICESLNQGENAHELNMSIGTEGAFVWCQCMAICKQIFICTFNQYYDIHINTYKISRTLPLVALKGYDAICLYAETVCNFGNFIKLIKSSESSCLEFNFYMFENIFDFHEHCTISYKNFKFLREKCEL